MGAWVVTGANRGIGLELCRQIAARGAEVVAACRRASSELRELGVDVVEGVDVADDEGVTRLTEAVGERRVEVLINNAGILERVSFDELDLDAIRRQFEVNALGALRVTRALRPRLGRGSKVALITSLMGSLGDNSSGGHYGYRMSKAAMSMAGRSMAHDLRDDGIAVIVLHPGMVRTDMTGGRGIPVEESVRGLLERIDELDLASAGTFRHADGRELPW